MKLLLMWFQKGLICLVTSHGYDFIVGKVEVGIGNFDKIFEILTFLLIF